MDLCDIRQVKNLLCAHGFRFSKSLGQNFLCDPAVPRKIAEMCGADKNCGILEIGPGIGTLTCRLAETAQSVVAVELDRALLPLLSETLAEYTNIKIIHGDILKYNIRELVAAEFRQSRVLACANLPYYITSPVITALIEAKCFDTICVMVQREVAQRICAAPASHDYGALSIYVNYHAVPQILFDVPPESFIPPPKVHSSVIRLDMRKTPLWDDVDRRAYFKIVHAAFAQRRKTLVNSLYSVLSSEYSKSQLADAIRACGLAPDVRGERLSPDDFHSLTKTLCE